MNTNSNQEDSTSVTYLKAESMLEEDGEIKMKSESPFQIQKQLYEFTDNKQKTFEDIVSKNKYLRNEHERFINAQISPRANNWDFQGLKISQRQYSTHFFHHYTAKFIPQIPQNVIKLYGKKGDVIFDPFLGSGTTLVEAKLLGHKSAGIEINPMGIKIARAKVTPVDFKEVQDFLKWLTEKKRQKENMIDIELFPDSSLWFRRDVRFKIHNILQKVKDLDITTKNFMEVALSDNLKGMSNALMHRTMPVLPRTSKYVDRKHYDRIVDNETRHIDVYGRMLAQVHRMMFALAYLQLHDGKTPASPIMGDSRNLIKHLNQQGIEKVNMTITSPPYWDAQNYQQLHSLSFKLFNLEFPDLVEIGRDKKAYFRDMEKGVKELSEITAKGGIFAFVIGEDKTENKYNKKLFEMICSHSFSHLQSIRRKISNHAGFTKSISYEYLYIFKKS